MIRSASGSFAAFAVAVLQATPAAFAQTAPQGPPTTTPSPSPGAEADSQSAQRYEDAVRADALGKLDEAKQLAQQGLALSPHGPFAPSLQRLIDRITQEQLDRVAREPLQLTAPQFAARASPAAAKVTFVFSGAIAGISEGLLIAGAANANSSGVAVGGLAGLAAGLAATLASMSDVNDPAVPAHLWLGWLSGGFAGLAIAGIAQGGGTAQWAAGAIGLPLGALGGLLLGSLDDATEGDAAAGLTLLVHLAAVPVLIGVAAAPQGLSGQTASALALVGGTTGIVMGEILNRDLHWSEGRWALIGLSGGLGALVGVLLAVATVNVPTNPSAFAAFVAGGDIVGFAAGVAATQGLLNEAPRGYHFSTGVPPAAWNALPSPLGTRGRAPRIVTAPLASFAF